MTDSEEERKKGFVVPVTKSEMIEGLGQVDISWITMGDESNADEFVAELPVTEKPQAYANFILHKVIRNPELTFEQVKALTDGQVREISSIAVSLGGELEYIDLEADDARQALFDAIHVRREASLTQMHEIASSVWPMNQFADASRALEQMTNPLENSAVLRSSQAAIDSFRQIEDFFPNLESSWLSNNSSLDRLENSPAFQFASIHDSAATAIIGPYSPNDISAVADLILADNNPLVFEKLNRVWSEISDLASVWTQSTSIPSLDSWADAFATLDRLSLDPVTELYSSIQVSDRATSIEVSRGYSEGFEADQIFEVRSVENRTDFIIRAHDLSEYRSLHIAAGRGRVERALRFLVGQTLQKLENDWRENIPNTTIDSIRRRKKVEINETEMEEYLSETTLGELIGIIEQRKLWASSFALVFGEKKTLLLLKDWLLEGRNVADHSNPLLDHQYNQAMIAINWIARCLGIQEPFAIDGKLT